jgi:hypothetical protein
MGRPRLYATPAERQKAYRSRGVVKSFRTEAQTAQTIEKLAETFDVSENEVLNSLVKFALLNRAWFTLGIIHYRTKEETK